MERLSIDELLDAYDKIMRVTSSGTPLYQRAESVRYYLQQLRHYQKLGVPFDHLRDIIQAEQDGRLVVLPCKVGDTVYVIGESCDFCETYLDEPERCMRCEKGHYVEERGFELWMLSELNESIFLTREEAEAELDVKGGAD